MSVTSLSHIATNRRLAVCMLISSIVILTMLFFVDVPFGLRIDRESDPVLDVRLADPELEDVVEETLKEPGEPVEEPQPQTGSKEDITPVEPEEEENDEISSDFMNAEPIVDWYAVLKEAAEEEAENWPPKKHMGDFDERLRVASLIYYPAPDNSPRSIWENIEKDQLGRSLLWHGDCYRVIDDPNVMNLYVFETFTQYLVFCQKQKTGPQELPWVKEIVAKYAYLQRESEIYAN